MRKNFADIGLFIISILFLIGSFYLFVSGTDTRIKNQNLEDKKIQIAQDAKHKINAEKALAFQAFLNSCRQNPNQFDCQRYLITLKIEADNKAQEKIARELRQANNQRVGKAIFGDLGVLLVGDE